MNEKYLHSNSKLNPEPMKYTHS